MHANLYFNPRHTLLSSSLWARYGFFVNDVPIIAVNAFGIVTSLWATIMFLIFADRNDRGRAGLQTVVCIISLFIFLIIHHLELFDSLVLSYVACASSVMLYGVPLTCIPRIIRERTHGGALSPKLTGITLAVSFTWLIYGVRKGNWFVIIPNVIGTSVALLQTGLLIWCHRPEKISKGKLPLSGIILSHS